MSVQKNGNNGVVPPLDSATPTIVLADGTPYSIEKIKDVSRVRGGGSLDALQTHSEEPEPEPLTFRAFPDGTLVDLVKNPSEPRRLQFLTWNAGTVKSQEFFNYGGSQFVPPRIGVSLLHATCLPTGISSCGCAAELLGEIAACISEYIELKAEYVRLVSNFVLYSWFQDLLAIAVYLWVIGPHGAGKTRLLRLLHALCRRAVMASDVSPAALYSVPSAITPTLLIDEFEAGGRAGDRDRLRLLRSGSTCDGHVIRGSNVYDTFCAKVVCSRQEPSDAALASRAIFIPMLPTHRILPELDSAVLADRFQPRLLNYRMKYYSQVKISNRPQVAEFTPRMRDLALALAAPVLGNPQLEAQLFQDLTGQNREARIARHGEPEWAVATALYLECHRTGGTLTVGSLACTVSDVLEGNGETYELPPRKVGSILRSLGLNTEKLGNQGRGLRFTNQLVRRVHQLACELEIKRADILPYATVDAGYAGPGCFWCSQFGLLTCDDGKKLRSIKPRDMRRPSRGLYD